jgi:flagellar protein FlgJ
MRLNLDIPLPLSEASVRARLELRGMPDPKSAESARLEQVMRDFESLLLEQMLKEMRNTIPDSPLFGKDRGREIFNELLDGEYARVMEKRGGIGLADFMLTRLNRSGT